MKLRWTAVGVAIGLAFALTFGFAFASSRSTTSVDGHDTGGMMQPDMVAAMATMHDSPAMQRLHARMPDDLQAQCEAMHAQMDQMMGGGGMMGGDMNGHQPGATAGGMMGPGAGSMMGS